MIVYYNKSNFWKFHLIASTIPGVIASFVWISRLVPSGWWRHSKNRTSVEFPGILIEISFQMARVRLFLTWKGGITILVGILTAGRLGSHCFMEQISLVPSGSLNSYYDVTDFGGFLKPHLGLIFFKNSFSYVILIWIGPFTPEKSK